MKWSYAGLLAGTTLCLVLILQYPFQTMFPIGGDVTRYILDVQEINQSPARLLHNTIYPVSTFIVWLSQVIPISWPERFTWLVVAGHLLTALLIGRLLFIGYGWRSAAIGIAAWGLVTTGLTRHVEDATLAQLLSLPALLFFLEQLFHRRYAMAGVLILLATALHPLSGILAVFTLLFTLLSRLRVRRMRFTHVWAWLGSAALVVLAFGFLESRYGLLSRDFVRTDGSMSLHDLLRSPLGGIVIFAPAGLLALLSLRARRRAPAGVLLAFTISSVLLAYNNVLGAGIYPFRWRSYLILTFVLLGAVGLPFVVKRALAFPLAQAVVAAVILAWAGLDAWQDNTRVYDFYESNTNYGRVHRDELAAMQWMRDSLPADATIATSRVNRHSEWIPILTNLTWHGEDTLSSDVNATHAAVFHHREGVPQSLKSQSTAYGNDAVTVFSLNNQHDE